MADRIEIVRSYEAAQRENRIDDALALCAEDVVLINPVIGTFTGKPDVGNVWRTRPARGAGGAGITFAAPFVQGDLVKLPGNGPFGPIRILFSFDGMELITRIEIGLDT